MSLTDAGVSVLFSEPKIPQSDGVLRARRGAPEFQCSSASRKFLNKEHNNETTLSVQFQCSSASRKFLNGAVAGGGADPGGVSVLFSEPKIPQFTQIHCAAATSASIGFSALQRAENSSMRALPTNPRGDQRFSALQRAENSSINTPFRALSELFRSFSALQRAENSSIRRLVALGSQQRAFQCSSASRKFLNIY